MKIAASALAACLAATAAVAQEDGSTWMVDTPKEADASLTFSLPGAAGPSVGMRCAPKSGQVRFSVALSKAIGVRSDAQGAWYDEAGLRGPWPRSVTLTSLEAAATLRGQAHADATTGGTSVMSEVSTRAPVIAAFRKSGELSITSLDETVTLPRAKTSMVRKFLRACK